MSSHLQLFLQGCTGDKPTQTAPYTSLGCSGYRTGAQGLVLAPPRAFPNPWAALLLPGALLHPGHPAPLRQPHHDPLRCSQRALPQLHTDVQTAAGGNLPVQDTQRSPAEHQSTGVTGKSPFCHCLPRASPARLFRKLEEAERSSTALQDVQTPSASPHSLLGFIFLLTGFIFWT